jgi:hypothetical protein
MPESSRNAINRLVKRTLDDEAEKTDVAEESSEEASNADDMSEGSDAEDNIVEIVQSSSSKVRNQVGQERKKSVILEGLPKGCLPAPLDSLPMVFAPPAALPYLVENMIDSKKVSIRFSPSAFLEGGQIGTTGAAVWNNDSASMVKEFDRVAAEIRALEATQNRFMRLTERSRTECARLLQQASAIRLSTYTGKVRHRQNLGANSVLIPAPVASFVPPQPLLVSSRKADAALLVSLAHNDQDNEDVKRVVEDDRKIIEAVPQGRKSTRGREVESLTEISTNSTTTNPKQKGNYIHYPTINSA